jgi:hypothetical protein
VPPCAGDICPHSNGIFTIHFRPCCQWVVSSWHTFRARCFWHDSRQSWGSASRQSSMRPLCKTERLHNPLRYSRPVHLHPDPYPTFLPLDTLAVNSTATSFTLGLLSNANWGPGTYILNYSITAPPGKVLSNYSSSLLRRDELQWEGVEDDGIKAESND